MTKAKAEQTVVVAAGIPVKVVKAEGQARLVQFERDGLLQRCIVPGDKVVDGECDAVTLDRGIIQECDIAWEDMDLSAVTATAIANALRKKNIWSVDDLKLKDRVIIRIGTNLIGAAVWAAAKRAEKQATRRK